MTSSYKDHPCDLCGSVEAVEVPHARLYTGDQPIHICRECGFVYVKSRRSAEDIAAAWSEEIFGDRYTARIPAVKARQTYVADTLDVAVGLKGKFLVDIGAGEGQFLEIATRDYGAEVFGIEPSKANCEAMSKAGFKCFQGTVEDYAASGDARKADVATIMWTLENCSSCMDMLNTAHDIVADGGHICVATGSRILVPFKKPLWDYLEDAPADTHCFRFSANTLCAVLARAGFEAVYVNRYRDTDYLQVVAAKRPRGTKITWRGDDFLQVYGFFERWHNETMHHPRPER